MKPNTTHTQKVCVECHSTRIKNDKDACEVYCQQCGLVHQASIDYANGNKINLPWGLYR